MNTTNFYKWISDDLTAIHRIPRISENDPKQALLNILTHLYDNVDSLNPDFLRGNFASLCDAFEIDDYIIRDQDALCITHYRDKWDAEDRCKEYYETMMSKIKKNTEILKRQLCSSIPFNSTCVTESLKEICWSCDVPMNFYEKVNVCRKFETIANMPNFLKKYA